MPFTPLADDEAGTPAHGFTPLAQSGPRRGFTPLPEQDQGPSLAKTIALNNPATAAVEAGLNLASQAVALPVAGIAGLATEAGRALGLTDRSGADVVRDVGETLTYQPRGEMGQQAAGLVAYPFEKLAEAGQWAGGKTLEATGSPLAATAVDTAVNALPMLLGPAKKGATALRDRIAGRPEEIPVEAAGRPAEPFPGEATPAAAAQAQLRPTESMPGASNVLPDDAEAGRRPLAAPEPANQSVPDALRERGLPLADEAQQAPAGWQPAAGELRGLPDELAGDAKGMATPEQPEISAKSRTSLDEAGAPVEQSQASPVAEPWRGGDQAGPTERNFALSSTTPPPPGLDALRTGDAFQTPQEPAARPLALDPNASPLSRAAVGAYPELNAGRLAEDLNPMAPAAERSILQSAPREILDRTSGAAVERPAPGFTPVDARGVELLADRAPLAESSRIPRTEPVASQAPAPRPGFTPLAEGVDAIQASRTQQMAPGAAYTGFIQDNRFPAADASVVGRDAPIRREDILVPFAKELGASIYTGRVKGKGTMGFFRRGNEEVRIKRHADLETTAHEMAHLIDARVPEISQTWRALGNTALREELRSVSYDKTKLSEGFAEGVRLWMTQPEELQAKAPLVSAWLDKFATTDQRYGPAMLKAREGMLAWFGQDALDRARSKIGDHRPLSEAMDGILDRFRQATVDDLHGVYRMEREISGGKVAPVGAYETARLSRASASIADGAVRYGYTAKNADGSFAYRGKGMVDILKPVADRLDDALLYFVGRSAQELRMQGREHLFTPGEIRGMLGLATPEFRRAFAEYQAWNKGILDFAEAQGVLNPETRKLWKRTEYLPFHRVELPGGIKGKPGDWAGIQALTGGTENIRDVLGNMLGNAAMLIDKAVKNEARVKIAELASRPGGGRFMAKIPPGERPVKIGGDQVLKALFDRYGIVLDGDTKPFEFLLTHQAPAGGNVVAVLKGGKPVWYEVADPILYRALSAIDRPPMAWLTKWLAVPKRVGQTTITLTPDFMLANIARDTIMGAVMSRSGFRPVLDSLRGMRARVAEDPACRDFIANGGGLSSLYLDEGHLRTKLEKFYTRQGIDYRTVLDAPSKFMGFVETLGDAFESSTRLGEYNRAITRGEHPRHAAYQGREVSTDFAMRGDSKALGFLYDTVMFLRPAVVSFDRLYRGLAHDPNRAAIGAKAAMLALASVGLYLLNRNDPRYADLPDWDRDANWHFFIGDQHFRYPKIWEIGVLASLAERTTEKLMQADALGLGKDFARIVANTFSLNLMPQIAAPLVEQATNKNRFTGAPIETPGMENVQPFLRAKPGTSESMKALGMASRDMPEALQVNPARAEALLRGYLNTWAMYGLMLTDRAFFNDKLPTARTDQLPVVRRFYAQEPAQHTRFEDQFYDMLGEADRLQGTLRALDKMGRPEIADEKEMTSRASTPTCWPPGETAASRPMRSASGSIPSPSSAINC